MWTMPDSAGLAGEAGGADLPPSLRVDARLRLAVEKYGGRLRLAERQEAGAFRFRMPRREPDAIEAMLVNVAGGLAGGDRVSLAARSYEGASLVLASAAGERIYRSGGDETRISLRLQADAGSILVWLPHETVLHNGARLRRDVNLSLHPEARMLFGELMQFGRVASGERFQNGALLDHWQLRIGERLVFAEAVRLEGDILVRSQRPGALGKAAFMASLLLAGANASDRLTAIRAALCAHPDVMAAASAVCGLVFARLLSDNDVALRKAFLEAVRAASGGVMPLPRVLMTAQ
jgi:urease accessory protein